MNNALLRSLIVFGVCIVLAVWLGFLLAGPVTYSSLAIYSILAFILVFPILLRWHYQLLLFCWSFFAVVPFVPGRPSLGLTLILLSLGISVLQRMISTQSQFIRVPQLTLPFFCILAVVAFTAKMTGFGIRALGGSVYGGHKYIYLIAGILGYFALTAKQIPPARRNLYLALFFLGGVSAVFEDLTAFLPPSFYFVFYFFDVNTYALQPLGVDANPTRFSGTALAGLAVFSFLLVRHGLRGIFLSRKPWRWMLLFLAMACGLLGGFRGYAATLALTFAIQYFLEGLHRTKLMAVFMSAGILGALALIPLSDHLPYNFQRSISFLPYKINADAKLNAQATLKWRLDMWSALLPQIPQYLLLGKGYNINPLDYEFVLGPEASIHSTAENDPLALAEDFHNGPISVVIPFGIWGCLAFPWFIIAALRVLYLNYRYSDPDLKIANSFLLAAFSTHVIMFMFIGGDFSADMMPFCGVLGLGVALNGGVRRPVRVVQPALGAESPRGFVPVPASPAPAFQRRLPGIQ